MADQPATPHRLPGRLGHPGMALRDDPRADPRMIAAMAPYGLADPQPPPPVDMHSSLEALLAFCDEAETAYEAVNDAFTKDLPRVPGVSTETRTIQGVDGNAIALHIAHPADAAEPVPGILHLHGGGMVLMSATGPVYERWRAELAATGLVVAGVEFRNAGGQLGPHPFPAGLNDCASGLYWMAGHAAELGSSIRSGTRVSPTSGSSSAPASAPRAGPSTARATPRTWSCAPPCPRSTWGRSGTSRRSRTGFAVSARAADACPI